MLQVCLNGVRSRSESRWIPVTPAELAAEAVRAVRAGAEDVHLHPKGADGLDSLEPHVVGAAVSAVRAVLPERVRVGVTTGAWAVPDPGRRVELIRSWTVLPDHASVNWHEEGAEAVAGVLLQRGVGIEAGIWSGTDGARRFRTWPLAHRVLRVLAEVTDSGPGTAAATATALIRELGEGLPVAVLLHGEDGGAWPVLRAAAGLGLDTRIGLEDVLVLPDGSAAEGNAKLVRAARKILDEHRTRGL
ncbi:3-keto-5-aminohexanoate cleavage protein [Streptomyces ficellus]|uniref:3-keto-5-aminohexanoate cleavage protein n=1 Tax=Streptomyces ficellus TaxID=1977088 RepID=A0ABT7Z9Z9_9ACTN|nr:3-keto-5-aminohexanoate cleavage protein [Streptomyces ficellus]MDN3296343.1 3-keto-5-aminohexanoate cleavage protein [Streptomyces ficellus]